MVQISRHPGRQLNDLDSSASWSRSDPTSSAGGPSQGSAAFKALLNPQSASAGGNAGPISSQSNQQPSGSNRHNTMDEWADIFDQCKTAVNGTDVNQGSSQQGEAPAQPFINRMGDQQVSFTAATGPFESFKSMGYAEAEDCMFGESDDDGPPSSSNGSQRLPYFGAIADWPLKQMPHLPVSCQNICCHHILMPTSCLTCQQQQVGSMFLNMPGMHQLCSYARCPAALIESCKAMQALISNHMRHHHFLHAIHKIMVIVCASTEAFPRNSLCIVAVISTTKRLPFAVSAGHEHTAYICQLTGQLALSISQLHLSPRHVCYSRLHHGAYTDASRGAMQLARPLLLLLLLWLLLKQLPLQAPHRSPRKRPQSWTLM